MAPLPEDETAEARILWRHLQISLYLLGRPPQPGLSWAERPAAMLLEIHALLPPFAWQAVDGPLHTFHRWPARAALS